MKKRKTGAERRKEVQEALKILGTGIPVVLAIVTREEEGVPQILLQERSIKGDPHEGTLEGPAGWLDPFENPFEAGKREVREEAGIKVDGDYPIQGSYVSPDGKYEAIAMECFGIISELVNDLPRTGFIFHYKMAGDQETRPQKDESANHVWFDIQTLKRMVKEEPGKFFPLYLPALRMFLNKN